MADIIENPVNYNGESFFVRHAFIDERKNRKKRR